MKIIGAGLAGLLAANMLRHKKPTIFEAKSALPNNHSAVLRFRSHVIGDVTGIDFRKVQVIKATLRHRNPIADALSYSDKNTGMMRSDRSIPNDVVYDERYIAPPDLVQQLASAIPTGQIVFDSKTDHWMGWRRTRDTETATGTTISTIPMPALMDILRYPKSVEFKAINGVNLRAKIAHCDAYVSLYTPAPHHPFSRITITGDELIVELPNRTAEHFDDYAMIYDAARLLGIEAERMSGITATTQSYAKIQSIDEGERRRFMIWATDNHNIFSLGRYACWRPGLLLDDLVKDVRLIEGWAKGGAYTRRVG